MSPAGGDPFLTQGYTSLLLRTEDSGAQKIHSRQTLKMSLAGKGNQHPPTCFPHPVSGGKGNCSVSTLIRHAGISQVMQDPRSPSSPGEEHRAHWGWRWSSSSISMGRVYSPYSLSDSPPPPGGSQDLSTHLPGRPGPYSIFRHLSFLLFRSLPLCLQLLPPLLTTLWFTNPPVPRVPGPTCQSPRFTSYAYLPVGVESSPLSPAFTSLGVTWGYGFLHFCSVLLCLSFPQEGRLGTLTLYPF